MQAEFKKHAQTLNEDGVVAIEGYFNEDTCDDLYNEISYEIEEGDYDKVEGGTYDYSELVNWGGAVVDIRKGNDKGMLDVFNIDQAVSDAESFKTDKKILNIINKAAKEEYTPDNTNVYWNRSVTQTRDFHADTYTGKFKSFLYLTDVPNKEYGPFTYAKGTHDPSTFKIKTSKLVNKIKDRDSTDAVFYDEEDVIHFTAPKGTLIIANQAGYHRGHPQGEGKERMLMTTSYTPAE